MQVMIKAMSSTANDSSKAMSSTANDSSKGSSESANLPTTCLAASVADDTTDVVDTTKPEEEEQPPSDEKTMSKNQLKKKRKWERAMSVKKRRKQQQKEIKIAKAKAQGRDLEKERLEQKQREEEGTARKQRQEKWEAEVLPLVQKSFQVCMDCSFESQMTSKEINSLSGQIRYCYSVNRRNPHPCRLTVTGLTNGPTLNNLENVSGFDEWSLRAFHYSDKPMEEVFKDRIKDIVYLTSDSDNVVDDLDDSKIYVIGGIVDRNRLQRVAITRAETLNVATARLPLETYLQKMKTTKVLTCNHVFELLLKYRENGKSWEKALLDVLPSRKDAKLATDTTHTDSQEESAIATATVKDDTAA